VNARFVSRCLLVAIALVAGCVHIGSGPPPNFVTWRPNLQSSAQPNRAYLMRAQEQGYTAVINLAPPQSIGSIADEGQILTAQGLAYVNIPVDFDKPTLQDFERFSAAMQENAGKNVLVHCQINFRASTFVFLYRVIHEDALPSEATAKLTGVWVPNEVWKKFADETLARYGKRAEIF
jgi:protein tyrosine phosphatase (PTP) superfamily phosphohydrolase (DUF442 family)